MIVQDQKSYIGIDVSKNILDVYILPTSKYMQFKNDVKGIKKLMTKVKLLSPAAVVMEATGGYERKVASSLTQDKIPVSIVNPRQIRAFAKALGKLAKTDQIDAKTIALFAQNIKPNSYGSPSEEQQNLSQNTARRRQLIDMITMEKNRLHQVASHDLKKSIKRILKALEKELDHINEKIEKEIQHNSQLIRKKDLLESIKGVGSVISATIIADLPELGSVSAKQISALVGVAPYNCDSGTLQGKRAIWGGRMPVRNALYMATLVAMRFNARIKAFYQKLCNAGKLKKVAMVACMRKLLIIMNTMIKNNEPWRSVVLS